MKRFICIAVIGLMLLALLPIGAIARDSAPAEEPELEEINYINIEDVEFPSIGSNPDYEIGLYENGCTLDGFRWIRSDSEGEVVMQPDETFDDENEYYCLEAVVKADEGYVFSSEGVCVSFNWENEWGSTYTLSDDLTVMNLRSIKFKADGEAFEYLPVDKVQPYGLELPVKYVEPNYDAFVPGNDNYQYYWMNWYWNTEGEIRQMGKYDFFMGEGTYFAEITLISKYGYEFSDECTATINGDPELVDSVWIDESGRLVVRTVEFAAADPIFVEEVDIEDFERPVLGGEMKYPSIDLGDGGDYWCSWMLMNDDGTYSYAPDFNSEATYAMWFTLWLDEGYAFSDEVAVKINGSEDLVSSVYISNNHREMRIQTIGMYTGEPVPGDASGDGTVDTEDALLVLRAALGITGDQEELLAMCDIDGNGVIDTTDALLILRMALGITG